MPWTMLRTLRRGVAHRSASNTCSCPSSVPVTKMSPSTYSLNAASYSISGKVISPATSHRRGSFAQSSCRCHRSRSILSSPVCGSYRNRPDDVVHRLADEGLGAPVVPDHRAGVLPHPDEPALRVLVVAVPTPPDPIHPRPAPPEPVLGHAGVLRLHAGERLLN